MYTIIKRFWTKSISRQLMLGIALVHAVLMSIFVYDLVDRERTFLIEQSRAQAIALVEALSANGSSWVLANDFIGIEEVIASQSAFPGLKYAMFIDISGKILGFTDRSIVGQYLQDETSLGLLNQAASTLILVDNQHLIDVATPISVGDKQVGWARAGISREGITQNLQVVTNKGLFYTLVAILVGLVFAWAMSKGLTSDIRKLLVSTRQVQAGQRDVDFKLKREDELGELSFDFSVMVAALSENEKRFRFMLDNSPLAIEIAKNDGRQLVYSNPAYDKLFGLNFNSALDKNPSVFYANPKDYDDVLAGLAKGEVLMNKLVEMADSKWMLVSYFPIAYEGETAILGWFFDITKRRHVEEELRKLTRAVESSSSAVIMTDTEGIIEYVNPKFTEVTGYSREEALGENIEVLKPEVTHEDIYNDMWEAVSTEGVWKGEFQNQKKDGSLYWSRASTSSVKNAKGEKTHFISIQDDVTHEYELSEKLTYQASHDALTGLVNRHEFERRAERLLLTFKQQKTENALCYMDLDQFKVINDTSGHAAGDEMLRQISMILQRVVRKSDTLARLGGDEFAVLIENCSLEGAQRVAESLQKTIQEYQFSWEGRQYKVGVSIGLVLITETSSNLTELMKNADAACYIAKDLGRNRIHIYRTEDTEIAKHYGEIQWVERINQALAENRFCLYAQSIVSLANNTSKHYELLVRMIDADDNTIPPGAFLPAAERYNLISAIDRWVVQKSLSLMHENRSILEQVNFFSINLSGQSLTEPNFLDFTISQFENFGVEGNKICFEITETAAITNLSVATKFISVLKGLGCRFALDDFGSGLSSFGYLKNLSVDYLKIDGMFVKDILDDPIDLAMVKSINEIGHVMGMQTIAEFVENDEIKNRLAMIGVNYAQGYGIDKPFPFEKILLKDDNIIDIKNIAFSGSGLESCTNTSG